MRSANTQRAFIAWKTEKQTEGKECFLFETKKKQTISMQWYAKVGVFKFRAEFVFFFSLY